MRVTKEPSCPECDGRLSWTDRGACPCGCGNVQAAVARSIRIHGVMADSRVRIPVDIATAHFYLDDLTEEIGPTRFIPGSHRAGRAPDGEESWQGREEQSILCNAGDVVIFRSEVWHRGSANRSDRVRHLLQVSYAQRGIAQRFPPYLNRFRFDPEILAMASGRERRLMGDHPRGSYD